MGLDTDFNVTPYFDDYDEEKNFHRVLFKPSVAVQARELTQLQTILQNQVERFGENILSEGTIVKGGNFVEVPNLQYVKLLDYNSSNDLINVTDYQDKIAVGSVTGLRAQILKTSSGFESQSPNLNTIFVRYLNTSDSGAKAFNSNETITIVNADDSVVDTSTVAGISDPNPTGGSYGVYCGDGIIFKKGVFVRFENNLTIVSPYTNVPSGVVVGFEVKEEIVNSDQDPSLLDNANGFNNFNAPGADRLKLVPVLTTKTTSEAKVNDDFFAVQEYFDGRVTRRRLTTQYNKLEKMIEKRDFEKNDNFVVESFPLRVKNSTADDIDTNINNLAISIGPGIAYVSGRRNEIVNELDVIFPKAIGTDLVESQDIVANYGHYINVENFTGTFDTNTFEQVNLLDGTSSVIGTARIRSIVKETNTTFRFYIFNIKINSGNSFKDTRSITNSGNGSADVITSSANNAVIEDFSFKKSIFETGKEAIYTFDYDNTDYIYRSSNSNLEATTAGVININIPAGDSWPYSIGSTLNETQKQDIILVSNEAISPYADGENIDISGNNAVVTATTATQLTITLTNTPSAALSVTGYYNAKRSISQPNQKEIRDVYIKIDTATNATNTSGVYTLGVPDVLQIDGVWKVDANTAYSESGEVVTNSFELFPNQKDTHYGLSYITNTGGLNLVSGDKLLVKAKVFEKTNSVNSFFTVDSYPVDDTSQTITDSFIRTEEIPLYISESGERYNLRDVIDFRPYAANTSAYSTTIAGATENPADTLSFGSSNINFAAPNEPVETSYSFFLSRVDLLVMDSDGRFNTIQGTPTENPSAPEEPQKGLPIAEIFIGPYPSLPIGVASRVNRNEYASYHKRIVNRNYTKPDIQKLDNRIKNLENYVSISLLEKESADLTIKDANGLERFKNGILVDSFQDLSIANVRSNEFSSSIDPAYKESTSKFRSYPLDLKYLEGNNVDNYGKTVTLKNIDTSLIIQDTATDIRSCTTDFWQFSGNMLISPESDSTTDVTRAPDINFNTDLATPFTEFTEALNEFVPLQNVSESVVDSSSTSTSRTSTSRGTTTRNTTTTTTKTIEKIKRNLELSSTSVEQQLGDFVTNINFNPFIRSRDIQIQVYGLRPNTRFYFFFDKTDVNAHVAPGEKFVGSVRRIGPFSASNEIKSDANGQLFAIFRIPEGTFFVGDRKLEIFDVPLYSSAEAATSSASRTYHGFNVSVSKSFLTNTTRLPEPNISNTISTFDEVTTSSSSDIISQVPWPPLPEPPDEPDTVRALKSGDGTVNYPAIEVTPDNPKIQDPVGSFVNELYQTELGRNPDEGGFDFWVDAVERSGGLDAAEDFIRAEFTQSPGAEQEFAAGGADWSEVPPPDSLTLSEQTAAASQQFGSQSTADQLSQGSTSTVSEYKSGYQGDDPISQTFLIDPDETADDSVFVSSVDIFFARKSATNGCVVELREVENGYPSGIRVPFSRVHLEPYQIKANSTSASDATNVRFETPIALKAGIEYAIVIRPDGNDPAYQVWISRVGETDVDTGNQINMDTNAGVLFTSTNNKTWTPYQDENLKFILYKKYFYVQDPGIVSLTNRDNEFLKLSEAPTEDFQVGEYAYVTSNTFATGTITVESGNTVLIGTGTTFTTEYENGEYIVLDDGGSNKHVARIAVIRSNTEMVIGDVPIASFTANHYKTVVGTTSYYTSRNPALLIVDDSSAKTGLVFSAGDEIEGIESGATATISELSDIPITYLQANIFRSNFGYTRTGLRASKLFDGTSTYDTVLNFRNNNYFNKTPTYIRSRSNEITENAGEKTFVIKTDLISQSSDVSPIVDYDQSNVTLYEHIINNDSTNEETANGNALSKYVSRKVELADGLDAEDMRVFLTAYRPPTTDIEVWVKFQSSSDSNVFEDCSCVSWTKLKKKLNTDTFSATSNRFDYKDIEYVLDDQLPENGKGAFLQAGDTFTYTGPDGEVYNDFKYFAVKIVYLAETHSKVPRVKDMRAIAVS